MSRVSRRKTLSHSEIENFLSEIDVPSETDKKSLPSYGAQYCVPLDSLVSDSSIDNANETRKFNAQISDVEMIRAFTRATFSSYRKGVPVEPDQTLCSIGRELLSVTAYPILSRRLLCPNDYQYPSSSLEGKKALLMSLSPMLTEAEEQRKKETSACENFTRCKAGKGKGKFSGYDYIDIDVKSSVDFDEYEKRYLLYIGHNKKTYAKATPLSPSLNYITFHHRQRTHRAQVAANSSSGFPRRNLASTLHAQDGEENVPCSNLMPPPSSKLRSRRITKETQPIPLDDSTMELVGALLQKPKSNCVGESNKEHLDSLNPEEDDSLLVPAIESAGIIEEVSLTEYSLNSVEQQVATHATSTEEENFVPPEFDDAMDLEDSSIESSGGSTGSKGSFNERKRKHSRSNRPRHIDRRGTLSPASVRAMLLEACDATLAEAPLLPVDDANKEYSPETTTVESTVVFRRSSLGPATLCIGSSQLKGPSQACSTPSPEEHLYRLECAASGDELDAFNACDQPQSPQCKQGKKYARSGSPSDQCDQADSIESNIEPSTLLFLDNNRPVNPPDSDVASVEYVNAMDVNAEDSKVSCLDNHQFRDKVEDLVKNSNFDGEVCGQFSSALKSVVSAHVSLKSSALEEVDDKAIVELSPESCTVDTHYMVDKDDAPIVQIVETASFSVMSYESRLNSPAKKWPSPSKSASTESTDLFNNTYELSAEDKATIDDFGRELDSILCDVSTLGSSSPFTGSPSGAGRNHEDEADVSCFSPLVLSSAQSMSLMQGVSSRTLLDSDMVESTASPVVAEDELYDQLAQMDSKEDISEGGIIGPESLQEIDNKSDLLSFSNLEPVVSAGTNLVDSASNLTAVAPNSPEYESFNCTDANVMSMDDSVMVFSCHDDELEDFEKLESMVEREYMNGNLDLEGKFTIHVLAPDERIERSDKGVDDTVLAQCISHSIDSFVQTSLPLPGRDKSVTPSPESISPIEQKAASAERRRLGISSIPRYSPGGVTSTSARLDSAPPVQPLAVTAAAGSRLPSISTPNLFESPPSIDVSAALARAKARYEEKLLVARWQFEWDIVSVQAANAAIMKWDVCNK